MNLETLSQEQLRICQNEDFVHKFFAVFFIGSLFVVKSDSANVFGFNFDSRVNLNSGRRSKFRSKSKNISKYTKKNTNNNRWGPFEVFK